MQNQICLVKHFKESGQHLTGGPIQCTACGQRCQILEGAGRLLVVVEVVVLSSSSSSSSCSELDV